MYKGDVSNESMRKVISVVGDTLNISVKFDITDFPQWVLFVNASNTIRVSRAIIFLGISNK